MQNAPAIRMYHGIHRVLVHHPQPREQVSDVVPVEDAAVELVAVGADPVVSDGDEEPLIVGAEERRSPEVGRDPLQGLKDRPDYQDDFLNCRR